MMDELASALLTCDFGQVWARYDFVQRVAHKVGLTLGNTLHKIAYHFGQDLTQLWATCFMKPDGTLAQNRRRLWARFYTTLGCYDVTCPKSPELSRPERDHPCLVPHSRKKFDTQIGSPRLAPLISEKLNPYLIILHVGFGAIRAWIFTKTRQFCNAM